VKRLPLWAAAVWITFCPFARADTPPDFDTEIAPILKNRCVRCHGPARQDGKLNLALPPGLVRGGKKGHLIVAGQPKHSLLWQRIDDGSMPKDEEPLGALEKDRIQRWIQAGAPGLPRQVSLQPEGDEHWASQPLGSPTFPRVKDATHLKTPLDLFVQAQLEQKKLTLGREANRLTLIRRVSFDLTGLPPTLAEIEEFVQDPRPSAYEAMVERYLNSPGYGQRWGKYWLDAAGYADSNGYFNADTDRPHAWRYRDYVIKAIQEDLPFDQFIREQIAGDEMARYRETKAPHPRWLEMLTATHFLRNGPDGTDSSDGNEDEVRADKYAVLEGTQQIIGASLLGLTIQCARCHDHKFEPFTQKEYYRFQAILYPAFPVSKWAKTRDRVIQAATPEELKVYQAKVKSFEEELARLRQEFRAWTQAHPEPSRVLFSDSFDSPGETVATHWSNHAPGDDAPLGSPLVGLDTRQAPGAHIREGRLHLVESGAPGDRALSTKRAFDWAPAETGAWVQASFDLVEGAPYVGYLVALGDYQDKVKGHRGNLLFDGAQSGQAKLYLDYPGSDSTQPGAIGVSGYQAGRRYGIRLTRIDKDTVEASQVVDGVVEANTVKIPARDLPRGGFGFALCCGRSFVVDQVVIETSVPPGQMSETDKQKESKRKAKARDWSKRIAALEKKRPGEPGLLAPVTDLGPVQPAVPLLDRGVHKNPGPLVTPGAPQALSEPGNPAEFPAKPIDLTQSTGNRLALAHWLTQPGSRASARLARVTVNRWWQHHFGTGLVSTTENLGYSGASPTHPELLDYLAHHLVTSGWSQKSLHRLILHSAVYRQPSQASADTLARDGDNRWLSRFPVRRLDAESIRDGMLAVSGEADTTCGGPPIATTRAGEGEVVVEETSPGALRRSVYLQQKRTQVTGILDVFDAPSLVFQCSARVSTTVPLQSLNMLNSPFARKRAQGLARRVLAGPDKSDQARLERALLLAWSRKPTLAESESAHRFFSAQAKAYEGQADAELKVWTDFASMVFAANAFLYVE